MSKKNSLIELYRFVAAISILVFHVASGFENGQVTNWRLGVEFFFILSGFLLMNHCDKHPEDTPIHVTFGKIKSVYPHIFLIYLVAASICAREKNENLIIVLYKYLHELLLLTNALIGKVSPLSGTGPYWFIMSQVWATLDFDTDNQKN